MPRRPRIPSYRFHKNSGQAVVTIDGHDFYLGLHDTPASKQKYARLVQEWLASSRAPLLPALSGTASATQSAVPNGSAQIPNNSIGASASWELDLWGRISGGVNNADAKLQASSADLAAAVLSVGIVEPCQLGLVGAGLADTKLFFDA